jgi:sigma-B regulation protein RsbU (phosphoserine phosphatase)
MSDQDQDQRIQELFLLQRVAQKINSILDLDVLLEEIVGDVAQTFGYSRSGVLLKDEETNELVIAAVRGWTTNYHLKGERFKIGEYGMVGHVGATGETYYAPDVTVDPYYQVSEELTRSEVDIPLKVRGQLIGVFSTQHNEFDAFSPSRIQLLEALAGHIATAIENARLFQRERLEKERMIKELDEAQSIQLGLFPGQSPNIPRFEITGVCLPSRAVGGDWYDYIPLPCGRLAVVLADVSGKGMGAALLMSSTRSILRLYAERGLSPSEVLSHVNRVLLKDFPTAKFVTMIYAVLDSDSGTIVFANAGHLSPLLVDTTGAHFLETEAGLPLGIREGAYSERKIEMSAGSRFFLYSDGISEAMNVSFEEYGTTRIQGHVANPSASVQSLLDDVRTFTAGYPASDDITVVLAKALG